MAVGKWLIAGLAALALLGCGSDDEEGATGEGPTIASLRISPEEIRVPVGVEQQFQVQATWDDGAVQDVTGHPDIVWSSSDTAVKQRAGTELGRVERSDVPQDSGCGSCAHGLIRCLELFCERGHGQSLVSR